MLQIYRYQFKYGMPREERYITIAGHIRGPDREYLVNDITSEM